MLKSLVLPGALRDLRLHRVLSAKAVREAEVEDRVRASYERGRIEGEKALSEQLVQQRKETQEVFHGVLKSMQEAVPQVVRDTEQALVGLALEVARKIVSDLPVSAEMVEATVREVLGQVEASAEVLVFLHPADLELLRNTESPLLASTADASQPRFQASDDVTRGGCMVQTRFGTVDGRRETKFDLIKRQVLS